MAEFFTDYGLFLAKTITILIGLALAIGLILSAGRKHRGFEKLEVKHLNQRYDEMKLALNHNILNKSELKQTTKELKKKYKLAAKQPSSKPRLFILNFKGDIKASAVESLREEITAIMSVAQDKDEVFLKLENAGGMVHEHGLAASQLLRLKERELKLTVAVDKVAASGGYMMACVAHHIVAAPFAILGSVGVLAQIPNFHKLLEKHGVEVEQFKAGDLKRTVTLFGENTHQDRQHMRQQIDETHSLFKQFVNQHRSQVEIDKIATGQHWYGQQALELNLIDEIITSDSYLLAARKEFDMYSLSFARRKPLSQKMISASESLLSRALYGAS